MNISFLRSEIAIHTDYGILGLNSLRGPSYVPVCVFVRHDHMHLIPFTLKIDRTSHSDVLQTLSSDPLLVA